VRYHQLIEKLDLPARFETPTRLIYQDIVAVAIARARLQDDVRGINASIELIQATRGGDWPTEPVTEEFNFVDLVWHEQEVRENTSSTYALYDDRDHHLGCCYLSPMGRRTELTETLLDHDVDVSWWVTPSAYQRGYYDKVYAALQNWIAGEFRFSRPYYSNIAIPSA
jgi:hypothetical protein